MAIRVSQVDKDERPSKSPILAKPFKSRHLRARRRLQEALAPEVKNALSGTFPFAGADCAAITERVVQAYCCGEGGEQACPAGDEPEPKP